MANLHKLFSTSVATLYQSLLKTPHLATKSSFSQQSIGPAVPNKQDSNQRF
ncbi:unnamed protein product [Nezara viridula]|uniref:Uncharacterized protein n=1 Tax=Nezara viridula TaxID=85310 RepID=A0A9P0HMN3_NEZVI|nr:unnamed protein product [Nezara viridula]